MRTVGSVKATVKPGPKRSVRMVKQRGGTVFEEGNFEGLLAILQLIGLYNRYTSGVDCHNQTHAFWHFQRELTNSWKALFAWVLDVAVIKSYKISVSGLEDYPSTRVAT